MALSSAGEEMTPAGSKVAFGKALAAALARRRVTQKALAERLGVTQSAVSSWKLAETEPAPVVVFMVEQALDQEPGSLSRHLGYLPRGATFLVVEEAIEADQRLSQGEQAALISVYHVIVRNRPNSAE